MPAPPAATAAARAEDNDPGGQCVEEHFSDEETAGVGRGDDLVGGD
ncbi:hypothetical protein AB0300_04235 [Microbacterium sp. NPDC078814]|nr:MULTISPECIES: hypothetical protein [unclassified Microbacterium]